MIFITEFSPIASSLHLCRILTRLRLILCRVLAWLCKLCTRSFPVCILELFWIPLGLLGKNWIDSTCRVSRPGACVEARASSNSLMSLFRPLRVRSPFGFLSSESACHEHFLRKSFIHIFNFLYIELVEVEIVLVRCWPLPNGIFLHGRRVSYVHNWMIC